MAFDGIRGQAHAVEALVGAIAGGRVAHAYAFVGPSGVGRKLTALAFAQALLCSSPAVGSCGRCLACRKVRGGIHPDLMLIAPTPPPGNPKGNVVIRLEAIRELERWAALMPGEGPWKVFIVDDAERMTPETPHAFLKTLEEPPARTVIILILSQTRQLPPTVISRCQVVRFTPLPDEEVVALLETRGVDGATARLLARACQGRPGLALAEDPKAWRERRDLALSILSEVEAAGAGALFKWADSHGRDRAQVEQLIDTWWWWHRDLLCAKAGADPRLFIHGDRESELTRIAGARSWGDLLRGLDLCRAAREALRGNVSPRLTFEVTVSRLALRAV